MSRLLPFGVALAVGLSATSLAAQASATHSYRTARVQDAFRSHDISLWRQHVPASARYTRLTSSGSLRVIVFRSTRDSKSAQIEVDLGRPPKHHERGSIVIHLRDPHGTKEHVQEIEVANVAVVYLKSANLDWSVRAAVRDLRS